MCRKEQNVWGQRSGGWASPDSPDTWIRDSLKKCTEVRRQAKEDAARGVSRVRAGLNTARAPVAELVCPERPGEGGGPLRDRLASQLRASEPERADSRFVVARRLVARGVRWNRPCSDLP